MSGKFLAEFELHVMLAIVRLGDDACGAAIRRELEERTGRMVAVGALYATLARLGDKAFLEYRISQPQPRRGGRAKKFYLPTTAGRDATLHSSAMLRRMMVGAGLVSESGDRS